MGEVRNLCRVLVGREDERQEQVDSFKQDLRSNFMKLRRQKGFVAAGELATVQPVKLGPAPLVPGEE